MRKCMPASRSPRPTDGEDIIAKNSGLVKLVKNKVYILGDPHSIPVNVGTEITGESGEVL